MFLLDILLYSFIAVVSIQVVFYAFIFSRFAVSKPNTKPKTTLPLSVLICAKNEAENLKKHLPFILEQDYPNFELVLINDSSSDETLDVFESFQEKHSNIKIVNVRSTETFWGNKKYALTLGIKAAAHEHLLFTDADCKPNSKSWISEIASHFSEDKNIILGYGAYEKVKHSFLNKLIRYETVLTAIQYFSFAKIGLPYMGVGRNLAYSRDTFYEANGFIKHMKLRSGDDDLFINEVANSKNTTLCFTKPSFTISKPKLTVNQWFRQKRRHVSTANHYKLLHKILLGLFYTSQLLFWVFAIALLIPLYNWPIVVSLIGLRLIVQFIIIGVSAKKLNDSDVIFLLPFLELFLIGFQLTIFITNLISKPKHWK